MKNIFFFCFTFLILTALCVGNTWVGWNTFLWTGDTASMVLLNMCGWHPAIASWLLKGIYVFTGVHIYPLLIMQMVLFYLSVFIFIWALYCRWRTMWVLPLMFLFFTRQFYLLVVELLTTSFSGCWVLFLYSLTTYIVLNPLKHKWTKAIFYTIMGVVFFITLNSRQNAIIPTWPVTLIWVGLYLNKKDLAIKPYLKKFISYSFLSGIGCIALFLASNAVMTYSDKGNVYPAAATFVHQIVGSCIPEMDKTCFDESWWRDEWNEKEDKWAALSDKYKEGALNADLFSSAWIENTPFQFHTELKGLHKKWVYAITKHPVNFAKHIFGYYKKMWTLDWKNYPIMRTKLVPHDEFEKSSYHTNPVSEEERKYRHKLALKIQREEFKIVWDNKRRPVGRFLINYLPKTRTIYLAITSFVLFFFGIVLWFKNRTKNEYLLFFVFSFSAVLNFILNPLFTPTPWIRYMHAPCICTTVALLIFIPIVFSKIKNSETFLKFSNKWALIKKEKLKLFSKKHTKKKVKK